MTAYVRSTKPEDEFKAGPKADRIVVGDFGDIEKIKHLSREHDVAVNAGSSFTGDLVEAIITGQKEKPSGSKGKLIHISGGGNWIDFGTSGNYNPQSKVWNDSKVEDIKAIHKDMFNGQSDTLVLEAGADNAVETYIICPSVVYGGASASSPTMGIGYSLIVGNAKPLGYVPYVGDGTAVLSTVRPLLVYPHMHTWLLADSITDPHPGPGQLPSQDLRGCHRGSGSRHVLRALLHAGNVQSAVEGSGGRARESHACQRSFPEPGAEERAFRDGGRGRG